MSVRKRKWVTRKGEIKEAWCVDYRDQQGRRALDEQRRKTDAQRNFAGLRRVEDTLAGQAERGGEPGGERECCESARVGRRWRRVLVHMIVVRVRMLGGVIR